MNAYTSISGGGFQAPSPSYDTNGNTLSLPRPDGTSQALAWDTCNRLRSVDASSTQMTYAPGAASFQIVVKIVIRKNDAR